MTIYSKTTILPSDNFLPITPSPNNISCCPSSTSCTKYILEVDVAWTMSADSVYVWVVESVDEFCTVILRVDISAFISGIINLWSTLSASTVYLVVINVPSNTSNPSNLNTLFSLDFVTASFVIKK